MNKFKIFKYLHYQNTPLLLGNVWDLQSALLFQKSGLKAIGTSSAAIAASLGYEDGENMPFKELIEIVKNIQTKTQIPLTVDIEGGYNRDTSGIIDNIIALYKLGVVGINLEDSVVNTERKILNAECFSKIIQQIKLYLSDKNINFFINARIDSYLTGQDNPCDETLRRVKLYEKAGADGIFVPGIVKKNEIIKIVDSTILPVNVMCMPNLPDFRTLENLGIKRISMGPFVYNQTVSNLETCINGIASNQDFSNLFV